MFDLLFKNAQLVCEDYILSGDIAVKDGVICALNVRGYRDEYKVREIESHWYFYLNDDWLPRDDIEM